MTSRVGELVKRVAESDEDKAYHPEISQRFPQRSELSALEREIAEEVAQSLGRAGKKVERFFVELERLALWLDDPSAARQLPPHDDDPSSPLKLERLSTEELVTRFNECRTAAERALRDLRIQREALGMRYHDGILAHYPLPPRRS